MLFSEELFFSEKNTNFLAKVFLTRLSNFFRTSWRFYETFLLGAAPPGLESHLPSHGTHPSFTQIPSQIPKAERKKQSQTRNEVPLPEKGTLPVPNCGATKVANVNLTSRPPERDMSPSYDSSAPGKQGNG